MSNNNYTTADFDSQVKKILEKAAIKKEYNKAVIEWLFNRQEFEYAYCVRDCATFIGFTNIDNVVHVSKGNFCRKRLCNVCTWRRQSRFVAQTFPIIEILHNAGFRFIFGTVTVPNVPLEELTSTINRMMKAYDRLLKRRKVKRSWEGKIRALEVTYNPESKDFHPHLHMLIAVREEYFNNPDLYIDFFEFRDYWTESLQQMYDYPLRVSLKAVDNNEKAVVETLKYSFKTSKDSTALEGFFRCLRGRRLVSFSGVFADMRKKLKYSDFETVMTDDVPEKIPQNNWTYLLYHFDSTGGVYKFYEKYEFDTEGAFMCSKKN